jgi:hypothetical protein
MTHDPTLDFLPRRFVAQKRALLFALVMIVAAVVLRFVVIHRQEQEFAALRDQTKSLGMPWTLEELNPTEAIPDADNAATYYRHAFALRNPTAESFHDSSYERPPTHFVYCPLFYYLGDFAASVNQAAFDQARKARRMSHIDWGRRFPDDTGQLYTFASHYGNCRTLANHLGDHAMLLQFRGRDLDAIERWRDTIGIASHLSTERSLTGQLVALGIYALGLDRLQTIAPLLRVEDPVVAADVRKLIAELERDEIRFATFYARGLHGLGPTAREWVGRVSSNTWIAQPLFNRVMIEQARYQIDTFKQWNGQAASEQSIDLQSREPRDLIRIGEGTRGVAVGPLVYPHAPLSRYVAFGYERAAEARRHVRQEFRLTRVALAVRLFYVEKKRWPASTDELVPAYLASVPDGVDAVPASKVKFTIVKNGRPDGADRPMIYVDFIGSANAPAMSREQYDWQMGARSDGWDENGRQWRDVTVWPLAAYPRLGVPRNRYSGEFEPGFEASGLAPSGNSPPPNSDVSDPNAPGNEY